MNDFHSMEKSTIEVNATINNIVWLTTLIKILSFSVQQKQETHTDLSK